MEAGLGQPPCMLGSNGAAFEYYTPPLGLLFLKVSSEFQLRETICSHNRLVIVYHHRLVSTLNSQHEELQRSKQTELHLLQDLT